MALDLQGFVHVEDKIADAIESNAAGRIGPYVQIKPRSIVRERVSLKPVQMQGLVQQGIHSNQSSSPIRALS